MLFLHMLSFLYTEHIAKETFWMICTLPADVPSLKSPNCHVFVHRVSLYSIEAIKGLYASKSISYPFKCKLTRWP